MDSNFVSTQSGDGTLVTLLLSRDPEHRERLQALLAGRYQGESERLSIQLDDAEPAVALRRARSEFGGAPIGMVVLDDVEALEALENGADEVLVWPPRDDSAVHGFLDRTRLRAQLRRGQERTSQAIAHSDKLTALGTLVAGVAHEINNPLTALQLSAEAFTALMDPLLSVVRELKALSARGSGASLEQVRHLLNLGTNGAPDREGKELLLEISSACSSIAEVVKDLTIFARSDSDREEAQLVDVNELVDHALRLVGREIQVTGHVERDFSPDLPHLVVPQSRLTQVLVNVLINAAHAIREIERPVHRVRISTRADDEYVAVSVSDTGPGIAPDALEHIFDPFFTTKRVGVGTGLGLSISRSILRDIGGDLIVDSLYGMGATFVVLAPIPTRAEMRAAYRGTRLGPARIVPAQRRSVLIVDDDERILKAYARVLGRSCNVLLASDGQEAIDLLRSGSTVDAVVTELSLPEVDGRALYEWLVETKGQLAERTVFVVADEARERYRGFLGGLDNPVLSKPVTANLLLSTLDELVPVSSYQQIRTAPRVNPAP